MLRSLARTAATPRATSLWTAQGSRGKHTLVLMRHGESEWNKTNQFTGWYDAPLSAKGHEEAKAAGKAVAEAGLTFDVAYTSYLRRAIRTCWHVLEESDQIFDLNKEDLPLSESLEMTAARVMPVWEQEIVPGVLAGKNILIAAHGNSLRALIMHLDNISKDDITELNVPTGVPLVYHLDDNLKPIRHRDAIAPLSGHYLGNQDEIRARILGVKNQTK
ncbi:hypothetical protein DYB28_009069 [Aphanomyces astaci]|uniref:Phosphoglycerate mutase n=1 Tax=Aphanomyces astaci TaxID=112090 RepID=A0A9X8E7X6_APHAT|nr:hypothetical protein DYB28_009069 [Aphanomyces astaci]